jgi:hypothetical protein
MLGVGLLSAKTKTYSRRGIGSIRDSLNKYRVKWLTISGDMQEYSETFPLEKMPSAYWELAVKVDRDEV